MKLTSISVPALIVALLYVILAVYVVHDERVHSGGGWINLNGMATALVTLPVSLLGEWFGMRPDYRRNFDMFIAIGLCAAFVYFVVLGMMSLGRTWFGAGASKA